MRKYHIIVLSALLLLGCAAVGADPPAGAGRATPGVAASDIEAEYVGMIVEQALLIEALQGEIVALQEGGADYGSVYFVRPGESLWEIADQVLGDPYKWVTIYSMNCFWMGTPDMIYPNQVLLLP